MSKVWVHSYKNQTTFPMDGPLFALPILYEIHKKTYPENLKKKLWVPFGSYLLNSTADSAQFKWKWAGLAVLFSR